ncbi:armadillo-type protein [Mycena latifolia]|nr:armadillo-type protein [Mycena latifolia]
MPYPLTRQPTFLSVHSWWSDRNPTGPNINLHAVAKPLMKFMYHRDALTFIAKNRGIPLSREHAEIYSSYLACKYVSTSTKRAILIELQTRVEFEEDACAVADFLPLFPIDEFLRSPGADDRKVMCWIFGQLARNETTMAAVLSGGPCVRLLPLLRDVNLVVAESAAYTLYLIAMSPEGAQAIMDAKLLDSITEVLDFAPNEKIHKWMCDMLGEVARHEATARVAIGQLVTLLRRKGDLQVIEGAAQTLYRIVKSPEGSQIVVDANVLDALADLLELPDAGVRQWTRCLLTELATHATTIRVAMGRLVSFLRSEKRLRVIGSAAEILCRIARWPEGAQAIVDANALEVAARLLRSPSEEVQTWMCKLLGELVLHEAIALAVLEEGLCQPIVFLLRNRDSEVVDSATRVLYRIAVFPEGAQAAVNANVLGCLTELLGAPNAKLWKWTWNMLGELARHETTVKAAIAQLVPLLRSANVINIGSAVQTLYRTARSPEGAQAIMDTDVLEYVPELLQSPNIMARVWTCEMLVELVSQKPAASAAVRTLEGLLHDAELTPVIKRAVNILYRIVRLPESAQAAVDAPALCPVSEMLELPNDKITYDTWRSRSHGPWGQCSLW